MPRPERPGPVSAGVGSPGEDVAAGVEHEHERFMGSPVRAHMYRPARDDGVPVEDGRRPRRRAS